VSATVNGTTLTASAVAAPIIQRTAFYADSQMPSTTSQHLAVTCSGTCGSSAQGMILGGFVGAGATGALMSYGLQNISAGSTQVISGVAAFRH
jgi:drug/metabolite transporter (DMT)-like permease